jgi:hypothetical protein
MAPENDSIVRLSYKEKVPVAAMKEVLKTALAERLTDAKYDAEKCTESAKVLSDTIRNRLKAISPSERFKFVVQVTVGERREQGMRMGTRCFWDSNTDNQASETFMNDSIFAVVTAFSIYLY